MAYASAATSRNRLPVVATVAAIHIAGIYALVSGLAVNFIPELVIPISGAQIEADKPKPPPPEAVPTDTSPLIPFTAPQTPLDLNRSRPDIVVVDPILLPPLRPMMNDGDGLLPLPTPSALPSFAVKSATPRGNPGSWVTSNDYPTVDLRLEHEGTTRVQLSIGGDGRVADCTVTGSSGFTGLDAAACAKVTARARFNPATDESGAKVAGRYSTSVRWEIPD